MQYFNFSISTLILRFYLTMALVHAPFFLGVPVLALLACPVFLSIMLELNFKRNIVIKKEINDYPNFASDGRITIHAQISLLDFLNLKH